MEMLAAISTFDAEVSQGASTDPLAPNTPDENSASEPPKKKFSSPDWGELRAPNATGKQERLVLVIAGSRTNISDGRCEQIVKTLRGIIQCTDLEIMRIEAGSVVMYLRANWDCRIDSYREAARELEKREEVSVLGFGTEANFEQALKAEGEFTAASLELIQWPNTLPDGKWIERPEFVTLRAKVSGAQSTSTILLGVPGSGKTSLLSAKAHAWRAVVGSKGWFDFLKKFALPSAMRDNKISYLTSLVLKSAWTFSRQSICSVTRIGGYPRMSLQLGCNCYVLNQSKRLGKC